MAVWVVWVWLEAACLHGRSVQVASIGVQS
jgi:hypothetical protein